MSSRSVLVVLSEIEKAMDGIENAVSGRTAEDLPNDFPYPRPMRFQASSPAIL